MMDKTILLILILSNLSTLGLFLAVQYQLKREEKKRYINGLGEYEL